MHDDSPDRADTTRPGADHAEPEPSPPEAPEDLLVTRARVFVEMLEKQAERARERRRASVDDIPADVPRIRGWR